MLLTQIPVPDSETLNKLAGFTGFGWTTSTLGFLSTVLGYGNGIISRLVVDPQSLLYLGAVLFAATLGLDRLKKTLSDRELSSESTSGSDSPT